MNGEVAEIREDIHKLYILVENVVDQVKIVAEGVAVVNEKIDRRTQELEEKINDTHKVMNVMYTELKADIQKVDKKINQTAKKLDKKIDETEKRLSADIQRLDKKIDQTKEELKVDILRVDSNVKTYKVRIEEHERVMHHL